MAIKKVNENSRELLVKLIKDVGQDLIDRAEEMVPHGAEYMTDYSINISFPCPLNSGLPVIEFVNQTICKHTLMDRVK